MKAPLPPNEQTRLKALHHYDILDTAPEQDFDDITLLASHICGTPIALISLVDENRQWFKSKVGTTESETARDIAFCAHGILQAEVFVVNDAQTDKRFAANPMVTGNSRIRFYAGAPLITPDGHALGMLCVTDQVPRELSAEQKAALQALSRQVVAQLELRRSMTELRQAEQALRRAHDEMEARVQQRTAELVQANQALQVEVAERQRSGLALRESEEHFRFLNDLAEATRPLAEPGRIMAVMSRMLGEHLRASRCAYADVENGGEQFTILHDYTDGCASTAGNYQLSLFGARAVATLNGGQTLIIRNVDAELLPGEGADMFNAIGIKAIITCPLVKDGGLRAMMAVHQTTPRDWKPGEITIVQEVVERCWATIERRTAEAEVQRSQKRLRDLMDGLGPSMFVGLLTPQGILIEINQSPLTAAGLKPEDVLGKPFDETPWWSHSPEAQQQLREAIARAARGEASRYDVRTRGVGDQVIDIDFSLQPLRDETGKVVFLIPSASVITERKLSEAALEKTHKQLVEASHRAGMAEVATSVLHNVGNVLNSVNVASSCLADSLRRSKAANLSKVVAMLREHEKDLGDFFTNDLKGKQVPVYLAQLAGHLAGEQAGALKELAQLQKNIEHIKEIVAMQQGLAKTSRVTEIVNVTDLVEDALRMNLSGLARRGIEVIREFNDSPPVTVEKHQVLQILVNLVRNAKQACEALGDKEKKLTIRTTDRNGRVRIAVCDNGAGIPSENLTRIFSHGFTTKKDGHGFGLHSAALAAKEMGGSLNVQSDGPGQGATFTLELPCPTRDKSHE